jgi:hypothetical protein
MKGGHVCARSREQHAVRPLELHELVARASSSSSLSINTDDKQQHRHQGAATAVLCGHLANMHAGTVVGLPDSAEA